MTFWVASLVFALDRIFKLAAVNNLSLGQSVPVLKNIFHITLIHNTGAAFGMLRGFTLVITAISCAVSVLIVYYVAKNKPKYKTVSLALGFILGGALGNIWDRISVGYVIDFLDFRIWPVFNIADSFISIGLVILVIRTLIKERA